MKKFLSVLSAGALALSAAPMCAFADSDVTALSIPDEVYYNCDFSGNGKVDYMDGYLIVVYYAETMTGHESSSPFMTAEAREKIAEYGDFDNDGRITANDSIMLFIEARGRGDRADLTIESIDLNKDGVVNFEDAHLLLAPTIIENGSADLIIPGNESPLYTFTEVPEGYNEEVLAQILEYGDLDCNGVIDERDAGFMILWRWDRCPKGDVNLDGVMNAIDASLVLSYYAKNSTDSNSLTVGQKLNCEFNGDYNGDGVINSTDASAILTAYAKAAVQS